MELDQLRFEIAKAKASLEETRQEIAATKARIDELNAIHVEPDTSYPLCTEALNRIKDNVAKIAEISTKYQTLVGSIYIIDKAVDKINELKSEAIKALTTIKQLDARGEFNAALEIIRPLFEKAEAFDCGAPSSFRNALLNVLPWTEAGILAHIGEYNIARGSASMPVEQLGLYIELGKALPIGLHDEKAKLLHQEKALSFTFVDLVFAEREKEPNLESIYILLARHEAYIELRDEWTDITKSRFDAIKKLAVEEYNALAWRYFESEPDYDQALALFKLRDRITKEEIHHPDYREAVDEEDFYLRFLCKQATRMTNEEFGTATCRYAEKVKDGKELELRILTAFLGYEPLPEEKVDILLASFKVLSFECLTLLLGCALERGIGLERSEPVLVQMEKRKKKKLDLERCSEALYSCKNRLNLSLQPRFEVLLNGLLRSPHARKVVTKSNNPTLHVLRGEDEKEFKKPWGKPCKNPNAKYWGKGAKFAYVLFGVILPSLICLGGVVPLYIFLRENTIYPYVVFGPIILLWLVLHLAIISRFGRDEKGSFVFRILLLVLGWLVAGVGVAYFFLKDNAATKDIMALIEPYLLSSAIIGLFPCLSAFLMYKGKKKTAGIVLAIIGVLIEGAAITFYVMHVLGAA